MQSQTGLALRPKLLSSFIVIRLSDKDNLRKIRKKYSITLRQTNATIIKPFSWSEIKCALQGIKPGSPHEPDCVPAIFIKHMTQKIFPFFFKFSIKYLITLLSLYLGSIIL